MIPLILVTGFLGSGKTTLLQRIVDAHRSRRLVYLVNEFGAVDVDGRLLELPDNELVAIPGGSIFCKCLVGEFIRVLQTVAGEGPSAPMDPGLAWPSEALPCADENTLDSLNRSASAPEPEGVVVEASGIADPKVVRQMLAETQLDRHYDLRQVITIVDPGSFAGLLEVLPNITSQVEAADVVIINKTDLHDKQRVVETEETVRRINPAATIVRTQHCRVDLDLFGELSSGAEKPRRSLRGDYAKCVDPNYASRSVAFDKPVDLEELLGRLQSIQPDVYRAKGFVPTPRGRVYVDVSAGGVTHRTSGDSADADEPCELVLIFNPAARPRVDELVRTIRPSSIGLI